MIARPMRRYPASALAQANQLGPLSMAAFDVLTDPTLSDDERDRQLEALLAELCPLHRGVTLSGSEIPIE